MDSFDTPANKGKPYTDVEVYALKVTAMLFGSRVPESVIKFFVNSMRRGKGGIDWVIRQCNYGEVVGSDPVRAQNRIDGQLRYIESLHPIFKQSREERLKRKRVEQGELTFQSDAFVCFFCSRDRKDAACACSNCGAKACHDCHEIEFPWVCPGCDDREDDR